jgi:PAS domain S-box-containing protein
VPVVRKLLQSRGGAEFTYSPVEQEEQFAAYEPVRDFGWGVVVAQPAASAFLARNTTLRHLLGLSLLLIGLTAVTAFAIIYAIATARRSQEAQRQLAAIVESTADAIIGKDNDGRIVSWNSGAEHMYGYTSREAVGRPVFMLAPGGLEQAEIAAWLERLRSGEKIENFETVRKRKDGSLVQVALTISPVRNELGRIEGSSTIARDITRRKQAEQEREELLASLQDALAKVKTLSGMLPICASCKKIRNDEGYWERIETYIREHSDATFSHGLCPDCAKKLYPQFYKD